MIDRQVAAFNAIEASEQAANQSVITSQMPPASSAENAQDI